MNIFVNSFGTPSKIIALKQLSEKISINKLYISNNTKTNGIKANKIIKFDENNIPWPWDESYVDKTTIDLKTLKALKETEAGFYYLLERFPPFYHFKGFPEIIGGKEINKGFFNKYYNPYYVPSDGKRLYHILINKWFSFFKNYPVDIYITSHTPHEPQRYLVYNIVRHLKIPTIALGFTSIPGRILVYNHFEENLPEIKSTYNSFIKQNKIKLSLEMASIFNTKTKPYIEHEKPFYMKKDFFNSIRKNTATNTKKKYREIFKKVTDIDYLYFRYKGAGLNKFKYALNHYFEKHQINEKKLPEKFFYFPLHVQPELTTFPKGGDFTDQLLVIDYLSTYLPQDFYIVVKEHPNQYIRGIRSPLFYNELIYNPKVKIAKTNIDSLALISKSKAVVSLTGTVLWEAMFLRKPGIMFGYHANMFLPNVQTVRSIIDCKIAIKNILNNNIPISDHEIKGILAAFDKISIKGFMDEISKEGCDISDEECGRNIAKEIFSIIKQP